jgi:death-on-curing protein
MKIIEINKLTTEEQGGLHGLRDKHLLESAIANPQNLHHYQNSDIYALASSYAVSIIKNHPFLDGNKRIGFLSMDLFLRMNGKKVKFLHKEAVEMMVKVAISDVDLEGLNGWLKGL